MAATVGAGSEAAAQAIAHSAQTGARQELLDRIRELERQVDLLKRQLASTPAASDESEVNAGDVSGATTLEARLDALDQRLRVLARADEIRREAQAEQARTIPSVGASPEGFQLRSADGAFTLRLRGLVQSDGRFFVNDAADAASDTFLLRRVRPIIEATLFKNFDLRLMPDFGNGQTVVPDAYVDLKFSTGFRVRAGKQKQPFGLERLVSASDLLFVERALPTTVAGNRDVGAMAYGDLLAGRLSYYAGAFNGVVDGGSADVDDRDGKDVVVRVFALPFRLAKTESLQQIGFGVAASYGRQRGVASAPGVASYRSAGQQTVFRYRSDGTLAGTTIADGARRRVSAQGYYYAGRFGVLGEQVWSSQRVRRGAALTDARAMSWQLASSWVLTGERATYRGVVPRASFDRANGSWGAFEVTGRFNQLALNDALFPFFADLTAAVKRATGAAVGLNWYMNRNVKVVFDFEETHFIGGAARGDRRPERDLLSRVQFSF